MPLHYTVSFSGVAIVEINDDRVILRVTENRDDQDVPEGAPGHDPTSAFRAHLYKMDTVEDVLRMLVYNAAVNGRRHANLLDGWADLARDAAFTDIDNIEIDEVTVIDD